MYRQGSEILLAVCDHAIIGQEFREANLRIAADESFYGTDVTDEAGVLRHLRVATIGNLVGQASIDLAIREGYVQETHVLVIAGVPHAQFATVQDEVR